MMQQITSLLSTLRLTPFFTKSKWSLGWRLSAFALLWLVGLQAAPNDLKRTAGGSDYVRSETVQPVTANEVVLPGDTTIIVTICANEYYVFNGDSINQLGQYSAVLTASDGSDSIVVLELFVLPVLVSNTSVTICDGNSFTFNGQFFTQSGTYESVLTGSNGCDSVATLALTVLPSPFTTLTAGICEGSAYIFQGDTLTESGFYKVELPAANGCDSTVALLLDVVPFFDIKVKATICAGQTYIFGGDTLSAAGVYVDSLVATGGCDSTVTLTLKVLPVPSTHFDVGICTGTEYVFQGDTLTTSGVYTKKYTAVNGCDSLVILTLNVADFFDVSLNVSICTGEVYDFGGDLLGVSGVYVDSLVAAGGCDSTVTLNLTVLPFLTSTLDVTICQGDTLDYNGTLLTDADVYVFVLTSVNGCDSIETVTLTVLPASNTGLAATICQGATYDFNGAALDSSGIYTDIFPAANGCDSIVTLTLTVLPVHQTTILASICAGESYLYQNDTLTTTGSYPFVLTGANGCDSTVTIALTVLPTQSTLVNARICTGESYIFNGDTLTSAGNYPAVLTGANGCDSTVTLVLGVLPLQTTSVTATSCAGTNYIFNGDTLTQTGVYTAILTGVNGCDSTVTLTLTVLPTHSSSFSATTCANEPYPYQGQVLTNTAIYEFTLVGANGCDSIVTLDLTVLPIAETAIPATICAGESYLYDGDTLTVSGAYSFVYTAANGCDSTVTVQLTVLPLSSSIRFLTLCNGSDYIFNGDTLTTSGIYVAILPGANGCDSTATLRLTFVPFFASSLQASVCAGTSYNFDGQLLTDSGVYSDTLTTAGGCDSIVTLTLTVLPLTVSTTTATICSGETYPFNGQILTATGTYPITLAGSNGCDSTAVLNLTVLPVSTTNISATICATTIYPFNGTALTTSGTYTAVLTGSNGCDSTVVLDLVVLPVQSTSATATICEGESYAFNGDLLTASGTYTAVFSAANGCDSTVTLDLFVLPRAQGAFAAVLCGGGSYDYNGQTLAASGVYPFVLVGASVNGCDSVVVLFLTIFPAILPTQISASICAGESYDFQGASLTLAGSYTAVLSSATGCDSTVVLTLDLISVNASVVLQNGTLTALATNATYQWIDCNGNTPIPGATGSSYTPTVTGQYAVIVAQGNCASTSTCQSVQVVSATEPLAASSWAVQPNPARTQASVVLKEAFSGQVWLEIYDPAGRLAARQEVTSGARQVDLDLSGLPDGVLLVRLVGEQGTSTKRLVKTAQ